MSARANAPMIWRKCKGECECSLMISALEFDCERECECAYDKARTLLHIILKFSLHHFLILSTQLP